MFDEEGAEKKVEAYTLGQPIDTLSIEELVETIGRLKDEIGRLETAMNEKTRHRDAADALFGKK
jgi:uncharacterized small protein (DUF1192 family)